MSRERAFPRPQRHSQAEQNAHTDGPCATAPVLENASLHPSGRCFQYQDQGRLRGPDSIRKVSGWVITSLETTPRRSLENPQCVRSSNFLIILFIYFFFLALWFSRFLRAGLPSPRPGYGDSRCLLKAGLSFLLWAQCSERPIVCLAFLGECWGTPPRRSGAGVACRWEPAQHAGQ